MKEAIIFSFIKVDIKINSTKRSKRRLLQVGRITHVYGLVRGFCVRKIGFLNWVKSADLEFLSASKAYMVWKEYICFNEINQLLKSYKIYLRHHVSRQPQLILIIIHISCK